MNKKNNQKTEFLTKEKELFIYELARWIIKENIDKMYESNKRNNSKVLNKKNMIVKDISGRDITL